MPPSTPSRMVFLASGLMRSTRASPASISTPASRLERGVIWVMAGSCCGRRWKDAESYRKPDAAARQNRRDRRRRSRSAAIQQGISSLCRVARMTATSRSAPAPGPRTRSQPDARALNAQIVHRTLRHPHGFAENSGRNLISPAAHFGAWPASFWRSIGVGSGFSLPVPDPALGRVCRQTSACPAWRGYLRRGRVR